MTKEQIRNMTPRQFLSYLCESMEVTIRQARELQASIDGWNARHPDERPLTVDDVGASTLAQAARDEKLLPQLQETLKATEGCENDPRIHKAIAMATGRLVSGARNAVG